MLTYTEDELLRAIEYSCQMQAIKLNIRFAQERILY